ncbi:Bud site selection protein bud4 [Coemansia sp. RSA 1086]|nr:Bud site selection protein bud4 [Coemansia sp. RSA 1086]
MHFRHPQPRKTRRPSHNSDSDIDLSDGEDIPESVMGPIEIPKSPSHPSSSRIGSTPGMRAPTHIDFSSSPHSPRSLNANGSLPASQKQLPGEPKWPQQLYKQWFGAIVEGRSIQVHSILADHPEVLNMRRREPTPFHMALTHIASEWLGNDTTGMDGLQVAIMGYKNAYANWRLGNGSQTEHMAGMSADQMKEHVAVREVILGALIDAISPEQLDSHFFGRQQNTTLHLAAFYNDANLVERLLRQGAAVDIANRMGFLPTGITNDKPTLQWLSMYRAQVRGSRYSLSQLQAQSYTPESDNTLDQFGDSRSGSPGAYTSPMSVPQSAGTHAADAELEALDHFSDDEVSESSYIKQFADSPRSLREAHRHIDADEDAMSDEEPADDVSVVSSNDRCSLGLGGSRSNLAKRSLEGPSLRKRALEGSKRSDAGEKHDSNGSISSETAHLSPASTSTPASVTSYHTANGTFSDDPDTQQGAEFNRDASVRIKVDPNTLHDSLYEDIFSDEDDGVVQMEPSFCHSGAGLSDSNQQPSTEKPQQPIVSSSESIDMQSLSNAMAQTKLNDVPVASRPAISAFPVMISNVPSQPIVNSTSKPARAVEQLKQEANDAKGSQPARASSPFMLRDSLYEMIMGRSNSRSSMSSIGSVNSNALSNTSTVNVSKEQQQQQQAAQPRSPTSPTSHTSHVSPTSTTFDESNASASQTAISSPTENTSFNTVMKSSAAQVPEAVPEEEAEPESLPPRPMLNPEDYSDSEGSSCSNSDDSLRGSHQNVGFDSHSSNAEAAAPRPTAASLFGIEQEDISEEPVTAYATAETSPADAESAEPATSMHSASSFHAGRIGRRLGRETVDLMLDEDTSSSAEKFDIMSTKKPDSADLLASPEEPRSKPSEEASLLEVAKLPSDVPLTREKRDQYLQTLISRNTMRGASPNKRSAMTLAMRSASPAPAPASDAASSAGEDDGDWHSPSRTQTFRQRHLSKRSESGIDFAATRSPSSLGLRDRVWDPESLPRPSSSQHIREALSVSGASINGRMRANTINDANSPEAEVSAARKVSPSLSSLKTRNLVTNSSAKSLESHNPSPKWSPSQHLKQYESRTRAMSTPIDAQPPSLRLDSSATEGSTMRSSASTARIGRVAALSQNFERQQDQSMPRVVIPMRTAAHYDPADKNGAVSAPLNKLKHQYQRPATRSSSISSSHSAGGHGQATVASSGGKNKGSGSVPSGNAPASKDSKGPPAEDSNAGNGGGAGGYGGGSGGAGNSGGNNGDDDSSSNGKPSPNPRAAQILESNDSSSSGTSTGRGLAANIRGDSLTHFIDSSSSGDIGSSIFSSDSRTSSTNSGKDPLSASEPTRLHTKSRRETEAERKRRFRELAKRRKSGTLEKISNSGLVKNRKALFVPSEPAIGEATESMPQLQTHYRGKSRDTSSSSDNNAGSFLGNRGEASRPPDAPAGNDAMPSSLSSVDVDLERLQQANTSALHPSHYSAGKAPLTRESSVRGGLDTDAMLERTLAQAHEEAVEAVSKQEQSTGTVWSRGSGSDKSRGGSNSGDDSLHILSSLDTNSTPGSTPIDSAPDNTKVGLLAQYDMNQRRIDRRLKRLSEQGYAIAASNEPNTSQTDANPADDAADRSIASSDDDAADQTEQSGFDTMMPSRPRTNPQAVFGLSVVAEEDEENRNSSHVSDAQPSAEEMQMRQTSTYNSLRGLRAALGPHMAVAPIYRGLGSVSIPDATAQDPVSPQDVGVTQEALDAALSSPRPEAEEPQHSFDPYVVFGYTSEENSTMASRSSLERSSDLFNQRPGSSASRVMYMRPLDTPEPESGEASASRIAGRRTAESSSPALNRPSSEFGSASRVPLRRLPEMQQVANPLDSLPHAHVPTLDELDAEASSEEEPIPKLLFVESQEFDGYVPIGRQIQQEREERRQRRRRHREAAKRGEKLPVEEEEEEEEMISPLWFEDNPFLEPLPPHLQRMMEAKRDQILARKMSRTGAAERSELKRHLETATISTRRLHDELLATSTTGSTSRGTIKQLAKRARTTDIADMFSPPQEESDDESLRHKSTRKEEQRKSFLDSVEIPVSELSESAESVPYVEQTDPREMAYISQEFQVPGEGKYKTPEFDVDLFMGTPRKRLVLRAQPRTFSERVLSEVNELEVTVNADVQGSVRMRSAGQFAYEPAGTVRPTTIPQYVSPLKGVPAGPFFMPPKAAAKAGYLYMRILSIDDMEEPPSSVYFVIRNGIDTLATTPVPVGGVTTSTINQEFRILTDPEVSITMWMRFRSEAIISRESRGGPLARAYGDSSCMPPLLRRLVRRNTRSRNTWQCASPADSVFDFAAAQPHFDAGARRAGPMPRTDAFPARVTSAHMRNQFQRQQQLADESDPRSFNATQAPSSVFYEPGGNAGEARKGLAEAQFREETRGVAVVHVGEMLDEVFLRGLVDSWDVENVWENRKGARLALQLFFIPECPLFREEELPKTLSECEMAMEVCAFHNRTLNSGYMSQRGGDTRFWRRRYFRLIGGFLFAYHEETKEPRCFIDLNDALRVVDLHMPNHADMSSTPPQLRGLDLMRSQRMRRRPTHKRNNSDHSSRDGGAAQTLDRGSKHMAPGHSYASDSEPADLVDIADPVLQRSSMRRRRQRQSANTQTDSGVFSQASGDGAPDNGMQHSFSIEFKSGGLIEFYCESEQEKRVWVEIIKRVVGNIPKIPSWLIKLLHADVSERIDEGSLLGSSEASMGSSVPSSKFQEMAHPHPHLQP